MYWLEENTEGVFALTALLVCDRWESTLSRLRRALARDRRFAWQWDAADMTNLKPGETISLPSPKTLENQQHPAPAL